MNIGNKWILAAIVAMASAYTPTVSACPSLSDEGSAEDDATEEYQPTPEEKMAAAVGIIEERLRQPEFENGVKLGYYDCSVKLPAQTHEWIYRLIDNNIHALLNEMCFDEEYKGAHAADLSSAMAIFRHYRVGFEEVHRASGVDEEGLAEAGFGLGYSLTMLWVDTQRDWVTLESSSYLYTGGAHGNGASVPMTYNLSDGSLISYHDIFKDGTYQLVIEKLAAGLDSFKDEAGMPHVEAFYEPSEFADFGGVTDDLEEFSGVYYPRPALTYDGVAFVYPTYAKGCYAEGDIKIIIPYSEIKDCLK